MGKPQTPPSRERKSLIDEFNDLILLLKPGQTPWTNEQRQAYNALHRRIEAVSE